MDIEQDVRQNDNSYTYIPTQCLLPDQAYSLEQKYLHAYTSDQSSHEHNLYYQLSEEACLGIYIKQVKRQESNKTSYHI